MQLPIDFFFRKNSGGKESESVAKYIPKYIPKLHLVPCPFAVVLKLAEESRNKNHPSKQFFKSISPTLVYSIVF